jgi:NAD(P)-dependent dehydrogenase (short-subunit alcohol dehydrogenase family)
MSQSVLDLSKEFAGRRALVTGGSRGIGAAIAQRLLDGGASVVVVARNRHEQTPAGATFIKGDILTPEGCKKLVDESIKALGGLDILVNNAAAAQLVLPNSEAISDAIWQETIASNLLSVVRVTNAALLRAEGVKTRLHPQHLVWKRSSGQRSTRSLRRKQSRDELLHEGTCKGARCCS